MTTMTREELEKLNQKRSKIVDDLHEFFKSSPEHQQKVFESVSESIAKGEAPDVFYRVQPHELTDEEKAQLELLAKNLTGKELGN